MTTNPPKTPQQKKMLSYAYDRRNVYGENDKASRKAIPARKAAENRKVRRKVNQALDAFENLEEEAADLVNNSLKNDIERKDGWTKSPDAPLAEYIEYKAHRRMRRNLPLNRQSGFD